MKYPDIKKVILKSFQRPLIKEPMVTMAKAFKKKTTAVQCHIKVKTNAVKAIVDIGVTISIIIKFFIKKLGL